MNYMYRLNGRVNAAVVEPCRRIPRSVDRSRVTRLLIIVDPPKLAFKYRVAWLELHGSQPCFCLELLEKHVSAPSFAERHRKHSQILIPPKSTPL
jgi:hypothetical protein